MKKLILPRPGFPMFLLEILGIVAIIIIMMADHLYNIPVGATIWLIIVYITVLTLWQKAYTEAIDRERRIFDEVVKVSEETIDKMQKVSEEAVRIAVKGGAEIALNKFSSVLKDHLGEEEYTAREKEQMRHERHDAKVAAMQEEVSAMNEEVPAIVASILEGMSLGDQRIYHAIRRSNGIQARVVADSLPELKGVERPSIATVKRSISALTKAGLIEREGSKKTGQYVVVGDDEVKIKF